MAYLHNFRAAQLSASGLKNELLFLGCVAIAQMPLSCDQEPIRDDVKFGRPGAHGDALVFNQNELLFPCQPTLFLNPDLMACTFMYMDILLGGMESFIFSSSYSDIIA